MVRDSQTIFFTRQNYSPNDYIHLYDSTPYMILNGHIVAKLHVKPTQGMIGQAPNLTPAELEFMKPLSTPGKMCIILDLFFN